VTQPCRYDAVPDEQWVNKIDGVAAKDGLIHFYSGREVVLLCKREGIIGDEGIVVRLR